MANTYRTPTRRSANAVQAMTSKTVSADGQRSALGRNQKRAEGRGRFSIVRCYTLKQRVDGRWQTVSTHRDEDAAAEWVGCDVD